MPYGSENKYMPLASVMKENWFPVNGHTTTYNNFANTYQTFGFARSGVNFPPKPKNSMVFTPGSGKVYKQVLRTAYKGPRLPFKVWIPRIGKWVRKREPIRYWALKRVYPTKKAKQKKKALKGALPHQLNFFEIKSHFYGTQVVKGTYDSDWFRFYTGDLWTGFVPLGTSTALAPNPQTYLSGNSFSQPIEDALTGADTECLRRVYDKVKNQAVNLAQVFGERRQSAKSLGDVVQRLARAVVAAKKGNLPKAAGILFPKKY